MAMYTGHAAWLCNHSTVTSGHSDNRRNTATPDCLANSGRYDYVVCTVQKSIDNTTYLLLSTISVGHDNFASLKWSSHSSVPF